MLPSVGATRKIKKRTLVSNIFTLSLKAGANLRKGKMALLPYRQGINASHIRSCFTQIKLIKVKIYLKNINTSYTFI
jgi:hypothetical protein